MALSLATWWSFSDLVSSYRFNSVNQWLSDFVVCRLPLDLDAVGAMYQVHPGPVEPESLGVGPRHLYF